MAEAQAPAAPAQAERNHGLIIFLIWLPLTIVADLLIWFVLKPHMPPGDMSTSAQHQQFDWIFMALLCAPVLLFVWTYSAYALVNWAADICCLSCAVHAVGVALPVTEILLIWSAGAGAASLSPVPGGIGIVDIVLIAAFASAGVHTAAAVAATLLYRLLSFKICMTMAWFVYHSARQRRAAAASTLASGAPPGPGLPTQLPTQQENSPPKGS